MRRVKFAAQSRKSFRMASGFCLLAFAALSLRAVGQKPPKPLPGGPPLPNAAAKPPRKFSNFDAAEVTADEQTSLMTARDFKYTENDMVVTGEQGRYNKAKGQLLAQGNLVMDDPKHHVTGGKADVDNKKKLAIITENVVMIVKPSASGSPAKPDESVNSERKQGIVITCDRVEDYYKRKFVILRGHLVFRQKIKKKDGSVVERVLTAEHAEYDGATDKMLLLTPVKGHDSDGQTTDFEKDVLLGTKEGEETLTTKGRSNTKLIIPDSDGNDEGEAPPVSPGFSDAPSSGDKNAPKDAKPAPKK